MPVPPKKKKRGRPKKTHPGGRPVKYHETFPEIVFCYRSQTGASITKIAKFLKVSRETIYQWVNDYPEFSDKLDRGLDAWNNQEIKKALITRAKGYKYNEITKEPDADGKLKVVKQVRKHVIPDVSAIKHWQVNRDGENWSDKREFEGTLTIEDAINAINE